MTLQQYCNSLPKSKQFKLAITLINHVLPVWSNFAADNTLSYRDSIVGLIHTVPPTLLEDTVKEVREYFSRAPLSKVFTDQTKLFKLYSYFDDPITALQDMDWELPEAVVKTFYAVYNLLGSIVENELTAFNDPRIYVSINQAIDAIETAGLLTEIQVREILGNN